MKSRRAPICRTEPSGVLIRAGPSGRGHAAMNSSCQRVLQAIGTHCPTTAVYSTIGSSNFDPKLPLQYWLRVPVGLGARVKNAAAVV